MRIKWSNPEPGLWTAVDGRVRLEAGYTSVTFGGRNRPAHWYAEVDGKDVGDARLLKWLKRRVEKMVADGEIKNVRPEHMIEG